MAKDSELTDDELEELLVKQFEQQPAKCKMKPAPKFVKKDSALADEKL
ncbi:MAG: hypothetical protein HF976_03310 [ANME-2 cluster archaeon]|nr:hypothetical protein [ANME-2 cluster archaeon]MBC2700431.1 hypothetical protein [ANME-2 cluster archaeon]MBC2706495.1 hypothetical protein [ANME-2 cluster archaeon]MBC2747984.1 hypothetical protein [ANME-2 cluster archaeon]MBC2761964.1 hypothetical protein [ANME-2 cluster archaeon]